ncbi:hypothetical protein SAMN02787148_12420 [Burkholderia vietnamiensis]|nr:hypothetical protein EC918_102616 [Burkholderia vietnamiensis]SCZ44452.1 hypothetical protein SAMN02787148_12420 [Burkholderia vietnamiensis]SFY35307.1 hypothetical protein SAMN02787160_12469 [Burkholderia vietnamiensis]
MPVFWEETEHSVIRSITETEAQRLVPCRHVQTKYRGYLRRAHSGIRWSRSGCRVFARGDRHHHRIGMIAITLKNCLRKATPRRLTCCSKVVNTRALPPPLGAVCSDALRNNLPSCLCNCPRPGRRTDLIIHHLQLWTFSGKSLHRQQEVLTPPPVNPARTQDQVSTSCRGNTELAGEFALPVDILWVRLIVFDIGSGFLPVENIVGRIMDKHRTQRRRLLSKGRR